MDGFEVFRERFRITLSAIVNGSMKADAKDYWDEAVCQSETKIMVATTVRLSGK